MMRQMKHWIGVRLFLIVLLLIALAPLPAQAVTPNYPPGSSCLVVMPFHISGQYTATTASVIKFNLPFPATLITVQATARASGGTTPTLTVDVLEAGVTVLSAPISITALTVSEGTISDSAIADEAAITVNLAITGTSPTWNDISVVMVFCRR